jgi:hypothetical protein
VPPCRSSTTPRQPYRQPSIPLNCMLSIMDILEIRTSPAAQCTHAHTQTHAHAHAREHTRTRTHVNQLTGHAHARTQTHAQDAVGVGCKLPGVRMNARKHSHTFFLARSPLSPPLHLHCAQRSSFMDSNGAPSVMEILDNH